MTDQPELKAKAAVFRWLGENGWEISRAQFYDHCADGILRKRKGSKAYTLVAVKKYAKLHCKRAETGEKDRDRFDHIQEELKEIELSTARLKLEEKEHALAVRRGKVITMEEHEYAIVGRQVAFMAQLSHMVQKKIPDWIEMMGGNQSMAPALLESMLEEIAQRMSIFAADAEFDVILEADA